MSCRSSRGVVSQACHHSGLCLGSLCTSPPARGHLFPPQPRDGPGAAWRGPGCRAFPSEGRRLSGFKQEAAQGAQPGPCPSAPPPPACSVHSVPRLPVYSCSYQREAPGHAVQVASQRHTMVPAGRALEVTQVTCRDTCFGVTGSLHPWDGPRETMPDQNWTPGGGPGPETQRPGAVDAAGTLQHGCQSRDPTEPAGPSLPARVQDMPSCNQGRTPDPSG